MRFISDRRKTNSIKRIVTEQVYEPLTGHTKMKGKFSDLINSDKPVLVDFHADWCGPCKMQAPILQEVSAEVNGKVRIVKIDVDRNPMIANQYQVSGVPTLILFKQGQPVWRQSGVAMKQQLIDLLNYHSV